MKYLLLALALTGCGLLDDLEEAIEPPRAPDKEFHLLPCAADSTQLADTANYARCSTEPRPPSPSGGPLEPTLGNGGVL